MLFSGFALLALVVSATLLGGLAPLSFRPHSQLFLAFSAGTLVGLALGELIPEGLPVAQDPHRALLVVLGAFLATMAADKLHILHPHPHRLEECCPPEEHLHPPLALHGAIGLLLHSALDGMALAASLRQSLTAGLAVALALSAHKFSDGLTTVALVLAHHHPPKQATRLLLSNAFLLVLGFAAGWVFPVPEKLVGFFLLGLAGFFLYLGASDLLPSLSTPRCRKRDVLATALGVAAVAGVAALLH